MRLVTLALLWLIPATCFGQATSILIGPDGTMLPSGTYYVLTVPKGGVPSLTPLAIGGNVPIPSPIVESVEKRIRDLYAAVADPAKVATGKQLGDSYAAILKLFESSTDTKFIRQTIGISEGVILTADQQKAWQPFTDGMRSLTRTMSHAELVDAYTTAARVLKAEQPGPIPNPTPPPQPTAQATAVIIIMDLAAQTAQQSALIQQLRNDRTLSKLVTVLDSDLKDENKQPDPQVTAAKAYIADRALPRVIGVSASGAFVFDDPLPATFEAMRQLLLTKVRQPAAANWYDEPAMAEYISEQLR